MGTVVDILQNFYNILFLQDNFGSRRNIAIRKRTDYFYSLKDSSALFNLIWNIVRKINSGRWMDTKRPHFWSWILCLEKKRDESNLNFIPFQCSRHVFFFQSHELLRVENNLLFRKKAMMFQAALLLNRNQMKVIRFATK